MKLTLKHPLTFGKKTVEALNFRDYTVAEDYLAFDVKGGVAQRIRLIANLSGTDDELVKCLRGPDYRAAERLVDALLLADVEGEPGEGEDGPEKKSSES